MAHLGYLSGEEIRVWMQDGAIQPRIEVSDRLCVLSGSLKRIFPLSKAKEFICILDGAGKEVGILRNLENIDPQSSEVVAAELDRRYFTPIITAIDVLKQEAGMWHFTVQTQRGESEFYVRNWRDNAYEISPNRWQIYSVDGGRFDIPNLEALDDQSRKLLARLL
ncbi:hypothetical protein BH11ARM1_BH11ARM1_11680 [soil metagenome]